MSGELGRLAGYIHTIKLETLPKEIVERTTFCVLDTIGSALSASRMQEILEIQKTYACWAGAGTNGKHAAVWGTGERNGLMNALLLNGCMAHALELDDVHTASKSHPGAVIVPTAWTLADALSASGKELLEAVIAGYEVMGRIGQSMDVASNRRRGWHTTGLIGTFGAAAAAGKLLGLDEETQLSAFGIAGTQSGGLWAFLAEGATCKKLHPARAALNGVAACFLAKSGMTGAKHILDAEDGGFYRAVSDSFDLNRLCDGLGEDFVITHIDKKPYPCCRTTHHAIDAALKLRNTQNIKAEEIEKILVETYEIGVLQCGFEKYPENPVEAKFSIPFTCAAAFVKGRVSISEFNEETLRNKEVQRIAKATKVVSDSLFNERYPKRWGSRMTVLLKNGETVVCQIDDMSGSEAVPLSKAQETDKFLGFAEAIYGKQRAEETEAAILNIEESLILPDLA